MRKVGFERQGNATYLVYELGPEDAIDSMSLGMLMNNRIPGFAATVFTQMDNIKQVKCDVTARVPADQYLLGMINKKRLLGVFRGIIQAYLSAEDYMIDANAIQLELSSIFSDVASGETVMICIPVAVEGAAEPDLRSFLRNILFSAQYDERENRDYVAQIMSYLNGTPAFSIHEFKDLLDYVSLTPAVPVTDSVVLDSQREGYAVTNFPETSYRTAPEPERPLEPPMPAPAPPPEEPAEEVSEEDKISLFYLLQHYNKENAAIYKQQKERKKSEKESKKAEKKNGKKEPEPKAAARTFAVPGQGTPPAPIVKTEQPPAPKEVQQTPKQPGGYPGAAKPGPVQPGRYPGTAQPGPVQPGGYPGAVQSGPIQPGGYPGAVQSGPVQPGGYPGTAQPGPVQPGGYPGAAKPGGYPGAVQSGPVQPGGYPGAAKPGPVQPGGYPGAAKPGPVQPGGYPGAAQPGGYPGPVQSAPVSTEKEETLYFPKDTGDETLFMGQEGQQSRLIPQLIRKRNGEKILIQKPVFRVGRDSDFNDYAIIENRFVGHGHCHILCRGGEYFVVDDNSKNGTLVNGTPIVPGEEVKIMHGDVICLADEEFEFKLF